MPQRLYTLLQYSVTIYTEYLMTALWGQNMK
jgi:hypothetical protein